jgi:hypothetical protein
MNFQAVLFDCDGVLVDSEPITNGVLRDMLEERGWVMSSEDCFRYFVGKAVKDHKAEIEARTGLPLTEDWLHEFRMRRNEALEARLQVMPGAHEAVAAAFEFTQGAIACASGADRYKVEMQLSHVQLMFTWRQQPTLNATQLTAWSLKTAPRALRPVWRQALRSGLCAQTQVWRLCCLKPAHPSYFLTWVLCQNFGVTLFHRRNCARSIFYPSLRIRRIQTCRCYKPNSTAARQISWPMLQRCKGSSMTFACN